MKSLLLAALLLLSATCFSQTYYAVWEDQPNSIYYFVSVDPTTGIKTNINPIPGIIGYIAPGTATVNTSTNEYVVRLQHTSGPRLYTINLSTGLTTSSPAMTDNLVGLEYDCVTNEIYGIWEDGSMVYHLVTLDPATATHTSIATLPNMTGYVGGTFSVDVNSGRYNFMGWTGAGQVMYSVQIATGNVTSNLQPDNVHALEYNCTTDSLVGRIEAPGSGVYNFVSIDPATATINWITPIANSMSGNIADAHTLDPDNGWYCYLGYDAGNNINLITLNASNGNVLYSFPVTYTNLTGLESAACCMMPVEIPVANFSSNYTDTICEGDAVTFTDQSTNNPTAWLWDFPGGNADSDTNSTATVTYSTAGTYSVSLTVSNSAGSDDTLAVNQIVVADCPGLTADFTSTYTDTICEGDSVTFTGLTAGALSFAWSFPGGQPSVGAGSGHTVIYPNPGTFDVTLIVSNGNETDTLLVPNMIVVLDCLNNEPLAQFSYAPNSSLGDSVCPGTVITFTSNSLGSPFALDWTFASGTPATAAGTTVTASFASPGTYQVQLIINNGIGIDTATQFVFIDDCSTSIVKYNTQVLHVWPNPAHRLLHIDWPGQKLPGTIQILSLMGNPVAIAPQKSQFGWTVDVSHFPAGVYFVRLTNSQRTEIVRVVVE